MLCVSAIATLSALLSPAPHRAVTPPTAEELRAQLRRALWPTFELTPAHPEFPSALCEHPQLKRSITRLALLGDSRADRVGLGPSARWPELSAQVMSRHPELIIHLGDWVKRGTSLSEWRASLNAALALNTPLLTVRGNHDRGPHWGSFGLDGLDGLDEPDLGRPPAPLRVTRVGGLLVYLLDTEGDERLTRLTVEAHVQAHQRGEQACFNPQATLWLQHRPVWSRGPHGSDERGWAPWLVPALEALGVKLFVAGHDHNYERMTPSRGVGSERHAHPKGVRYLTTGGAATVTAPLPSLNKRPQQAHERALSERFSGAPHSLSLTVEVEGVRVEAWATPREGVSVLMDDVWVGERD